ncbi:hypothetical protein [Rheinheimera sp.]|uniref:hypothetical protein n=1 Tax=Rheinheimera sp. TaxID=1869214 RepID=UPI0040485A89
MTILKPRTITKTRVAGVYIKGDICFYLLAHACGELLLCADSKHSPHGACLWSKAVILWSEQRNTFVVCKYGMHDQKFDLTGYADSDCLELAKMFGIEYRSKSEPLFMSDLSESTMARSFLTWMAKHPKMATQFQNYGEFFQKRGVIPLPDAQYSGN